MKSNNTLIILPAYNVEKEIYNLLMSMVTYKKNTIIIDDGSIDKTFQVCKSLDFDVVRQEKNRGVASAVRIGMDYALKRGYQNAIFMDSDGQHSPKYIDRFLCLLNNNDFVVGNRFHSNTTAPDIKLGSNLLASIIVKEIFGKKYNDISCGYKAIKISEDLRLELEKSEGYSIVFDLFFYALKNKYKIATIDMEAIYNYNTFLMTREAELLAFIRALELNTPNILYEKFEIKNLKNKVLAQMDFKYHINNISFYGFYIKEKKGYIIQAEPKKLKTYLTEKG